MRIFCCPAWKRESLREKIKERRVKKEDKKKENGDMEHKYEWIRSARKTATIQVKENGSVIVRTPYRTSRKQVEDFLKEKQGWISRQQEHFKEAAKKQVAITDAMRKEGKKEAKKRIPERIAYYAKLMGVSYGRIAVREQKTRWGSCSAAGNLNFNWKLILMPPEILDYVVVHELAHRKELNHSKAFWSVVEQILPDYKERRRWLKTEGALFI